MKIESLIRRAKGTLVELDDKTYNFQPSATDPRHLAEVGVESHIKRLLSITEGYAPADGSESPFPAPQQLGAIAGSQVHAAQYTLLNGDILSLDELTSRAFRESGLSIGEWNDLSDEDRYGQIDTTLSEIQEASAPREQHYDAPESQEQPEQEPPEEEPSNTIEPEDEQPLGDAENAETDPEPPVVEEKPVADKPVVEEVVELDRDELAKQFEAKFGRKPNGKLSARSIQKALEED